MSASEFRAALRRPGVGSLQRVRDVVLEEGDHLSVIFRPPGPR